MYELASNKSENFSPLYKDDISYLPLQHQVISWAAKSNVNVPIRPNNEPLFKAASFN